MASMIVTGGNIIMYAIRSRKTNRWFSGIDHRFGQGSSHHLIMDAQIPQLFVTKEMARCEILTNGMHERVFEIVEVVLRVKS